MTSSGNALFFQDQSGDSLDPDTLDDDVADVSQTLMDKFIDMLEEEVRSWLHYFLCFYTVKWLKRFKKYYVSCPEYSQLHILKAWICVFIQTLETFSSKRRSYFYVLVDSLMIVVIHKFVPFSLCFSHESVFLFQEVEVRIAAASLLASVLVSHRILSPTVVSRLILLWYDPSTRDEPTLLNNVSSFLDVFPYMSK